MIKLLSNGCSFLTTRPRDGVDTFVTKILSENYNLELINLAMGGRGNNRISFSTKTWFEQYGHKDTFAVIGWSSAYRNDYVTNDPRKKDRLDGTDLTWRTWNTLDNVGFLRKKLPKLCHENDAIMSFLDNVFDLQNYFERKKIPYVMYNALPNNFKSNVSDFDIITKAINMDRFFNPEVSQYEYITDKRLIVSPEDPHPSTEGHLQWATQLKEFIDANNLRTS
jgi:hypothetical protein